MSEENATAKTKASSRKEVNQTRSEARTARRERGRARLVSQISTSTAHKPGTTFSLRLCLSSFSFS